MALFEHHACLSIRVRILSLQSLKEFSRLGARICKPHVRSSANAEFDPHILFTAELCLVSVHVH